MRKPSMKEQTSVGGERRRSPWLLVALTVAAGLLGSAAIGTGLTKQDAAPADPIRDNNRGVALMEQFRHGEAMAAFRRVTAAAFRTCVSIAFCCAGVGRPAPIPMA